jgi:hypothetical protein
MRKNAVKAAKTLNRETESAKLPEVYRRLNQSINDTTT